jgi:ABC-2 type transport system ATP-binding protein
MEHPDIIMLDEPTNGLDETGVAEVRALIQEEKQRGALILITSHNRDDIHCLSDRIYHLEDGTLSEWETTA